MLSTMLTTVSHSLSPILIMLGLAYFLMVALQRLRDGMQYLQKLHQVPCSGCVYFTGNYQLKCAVHPCRALSEEAINCFDYQSN
jgi:hypothetical protein